MGHLIIANHFAEHTDLDQVWCVVTPQNPHKANQSILENRERLQMVKLATQDYPKIKSSDIEFELSQPNYTVHTLAHLEEKYPDYEFVLIMGEDNLMSLHKWRNVDVIAERYAIYVYPRKLGSSSQSVIFEGHVAKLAAPIIEISSSLIRRAIKAGKNVQPMLPKAVWVYLDEMNFYK